MDVELLHNSAERLFESVNFFVEFLADFKLKFIVVLLFAGGRFLFNLFDLL